MLPIYIDIDGTLTENGEQAHSKPIINRIEKLKKWLTIEKPTILDV